MKKTTVISLAIVVLIAIAVVFVLVAKKADAPAVENTDGQSNQAEPVNQEKSVSQDEAQDASAAGQYTEYDKAKLASSESENYLFFHAPWCPQCRAIENSINAGGHIPNDVTIYKIDYDSNQELRKQYGVTLQTTFVKVDKQGNFIDKYVAYDEPTIDSVVENFINK
ncbi:MAG TPA: thioredoxin family protein [Candidatus Saccharimonadales bacterium]|nr:thioredoxin family protein [Candidatus Saccharimonadales bacterium]